MKRILYVEGCRDETVGGSQICLLSMAARLDRFGMVNLEAMYMQRPAISTSIGGPTKIFEDGEDGILIEAANPGLLAGKISELLDNPELRRKIGQKAQESVIQKFSISNTVHRIEEAYEGMYRK